MNTITLTDYEVEAFLEFQKHRDLFEAMRVAGVFNIKYGKGIINIAGGVVQNIVTEQIAWKR